MQYALVILDGASGDAVPEFAGSTSLEASTTPNLDALAQEGMVGFTQNVPTHLHSGSDVACLSLMGYDPAKYTIGRGAIEGASLGIDLKPGQVALRMNLCNVENNVMVSYSTDNISNEEGHALALEIKHELDDRHLTLYPGTSFRQILVVDGFPGLADLVYEAPHDFTGQDIGDAYMPKAQDEEDQSIADMLVDYMRCANKILAHSKVNKQRLEQGLPAANFSWLFWPGMKPQSFPSFEETYHKKAALNSGVDLLDGLGLLTGMKRYDFEGVTDGPTNDYASQGRGGITMLEEGNDFVIVHVEAPDAAGHDGRPDEKKRAIEQIDQHIIGPLREYGQNHPLRIVAMPDHPTPLSTRTHSHDPVPFVVAGPQILHNGATRLTEKEAKKTGFFLEEGYKFLEQILFVP